MITAETIKAAAGLWPLATLGPQWITNGHFAVRGNWAQLADADWSGRAAAPGKWLREPREPASEDRSIRIESKETSRDCHCEGSRWFHNECRDCEGHRCDDCGGTGKTKTVVVGQMVFRSAAGLTVVDPAYGVLLEGLTVMRAGTGPAERSILIGVGDDGEPLVVIMPRLAPVRSVEAVQS